MTEKNEGKGGQQEKAALPAQKIIIERKGNLSSDPGSMEVPPSATLDGGAGGESGADTAATGGGEATNTTSDSSQGASGDSDQ